MVPQELRIGTVVSGPVLPEPSEVLAITPLGDAMRVIGRGLQSGLARDIGAFAGAGRTARPAARGTLFRLFDEMEASLLRLPELAVEAGQFTVLLRNDPILEGPSSEWQRVIESLGLPVPQKRILLAHPDGFTNEGFRRLNGVDRDAAYRAIQEMVAGGLVMSPDSAGRGATYKVNPELVAARNFLVARIPELVRHVRLHGHITNAEYRNLFGVKRDIAFRELKRLVQNGFLQPEGHRRGARYVVGPALPERSGE